ncbi:uncharacterized protein LOC114915817 [Cajanus cajan]|uniref:uncharacterized protein LOC114915817 n=1 Tax=Cajanus cajan TaxID=3821 RepID=UPI0010FADA31|nr:uncharacterized protein LOC114915817 [Cajanus cajan]
MLMAIVANAQNGLKAHHEGTIMRPNDDGRETLYVEQEVGAQLLEVDAGRNSLQEVQSEPLNNATLDVPSDDDQRLQLSGDCKTGTSVCVVEVLPESNEYRNPEHDYEIQQENCQKSSRGDVVIDVNSQEQNQGGDYVNMDLEGLSEVPVIEAYNADGINQAVRMEEFEYKNKKGRGRPKKKGHQTQRYISPSHFSCQRMGQAYLGGKYVHEQGEIKRCK